MSVNRVKQFIQDNQADPPERFNIGGKQFTWLQALRYTNTDIRIDHETESDMVAVDADPEVEDTGSGDSQSQE